jgi:hypothetical protein
METKSRRLVRLDSSRVSGLQSCQAVGLSACDRTYGDLLSLQRLVSDTKPPLDEAELMARMAERRVLRPRRDDKATDEDEGAERPRREMNDNGNGMRLMFAVVAKVSWFARRCAAILIEQEPLGSTPPDPPPLRSSLFPQTCVIRGSIRAIRLSSSTTTTNDQDSGPSDRQQIPDTCNIICSSLSSITRNQTSKSFSC